MENNVENVLTKEEKIRREKELDELVAEINRRIKDGTLPAITFRRKENTNYYETHKKYGNSQVCEEEAKYGYSESEQYINNPHDKLIKVVLDNPVEVAKTINKYLKVDINSEGLEKYNSSYIEKDFKALESDIVYKMKDRKIFFLIEHQSTVDRTMPYRIQQYSSAIMREVVNKENEYEEGYLYPQIIPIVIYTGNKKWNIETSLTDVQDKLDGYDQPESSYKLIDANLYTEDELLNDGTMTSKVLLIEREKDKEKVKEAILKVLDKTNREEKEEIYNFINYIWIEKLDEKAAKEILKKIKEGGDATMMGIAVIHEEIYRKINEGWKKGREEGKKQGIEEGRKEGRNNIILKMLKKNLAIKEISDLTGMSIEEIEELKDESNA